MAPSDATPPHIFFLNHADVFAGNARVHDDSRQCGRSGHLVASAQCGISVSAPSIAPRRYVLLHGCRASLDQSRVASGNSLLPRVAGGRAERNQRHDVRHDLAYFSRSTLSVIHRDPALQSSDRCMLLSHVHRFGFVRSSYDIVRVSLPSSAADYSPAFPAKRERTALADTSAVLPVGQYSRVLVPRTDYLLDHYCCRLCARELGTCGCGALDAIANGKAGGHRSCQRGRVVRESVRIPPRLLSVRHGIPPETEYFARRRMGFS